MNEKKSKPREVNPGEWINGARIDLARCLSRKEIVEAVYTHLNRLGPLEMKCLVDVYGFSSTGAMTIKETAKELGVSEMGVKLACGRGIVKVAKLAGIKVPVRFRRTKYEKINVGRSYE